MSMTASSCLWVPDHFVLLDEVQRKNLEFHVECCLPGARGPEDVALTGRLAHVAGNSVLFEIAGREALDRKVQGKEKSCDVSFILDRPKPEGGSERLGFSGHGVVLQAEEDKHGAPSRLLLRLSPKFVARKLRKAPRIELDAEKIRMLCLTTVSEQPANMDSLRSLLSAYRKEVADGRDAPRLVDIAASGACLCMKKATNRREVESHDQLLLFLAVDMPENVDGKPYILLVKRVGLGRDPDPANAVLRVRFLQEMDVNKNNNALSWIDIDNFGSERLRHLITRVSKNRQEGRPVADRNAVSVVGI
ncbi:MAG: hypothetical protein LBO64_09990 [Desulfovibrio sp.]|jgi:hypothetical protein|nr:hypothetical protein [Desulfovibrio sp.]